MISEGKTTQEAHVATLNFEDLAFNNKAGNRGQMGGRLTHPVTFWKSIFLVPTICHSELGYTILSTFEAISSCKI
jgi:hypothetical protein